MKKNYLLLIAVMITLSFNGFSQLKVNSTGNVGVGTTDSNANFCVNKTGGYYGALFTGSTYQDFVRITGSSYGGFECAIYGEGMITLWWYNSDKNLKKNIKELDGTGLLTKLKNIEGKKYEYKSKSEILESNKHIKDSSDIPSFPAGEQYGLIAQNVETEFPELVRLDSSNMTKVLNYNGMIPILLEALKAQQTQIEDLQDQIDNCCKNTKSATITGTEQGVRTEEARLYQNTPNPFSTQTTLRYEIPETVQNAQLHICNMTGTLIKTITANQKGTGNVIISANEFTAGMYLYSLVCDGKIVDTKQMLLTE